MPSSSRILGRTGKAVPFLWQPLGDGAFGDDTWCAVEIGPDALERRADQVVIDRLNSLGRKRCDILIAQDLTSSDIKVGWPTHRLLQMRERGLCSFLAVEVDDALEAEWIATNAPLHAIVAPYTRANMDLRFRAFDAAQNAGVAIVCRAKSMEDLAIQHETPQIAATITTLDASEVAPVDVESLWATYQQAHDAPPKLRSGHPPETGA
jgi:hypothetical protein